MTERLPSKNKMSGARAAILMLLALPACEGTCGSDADLAREFPELAEQLKNAPEIDEDEIQRQEANWKQKSRDLKGRLERLKEGK